MNEDEHKYLKKTACKHVDDIDPCKGTSILGMVKNWFCLREWKRLKRIITLKASIRHCKTAHETQPHANNGNRHCQVVLRLAMSY